MGTVVYHVTMCSITTPSAYWPVCHGKRRKCNGMLSLHGKLFAFTYTPGASRSASRCFHRLGAFRCAPQEVPSRGRGQLRWLFLFNRQWRRAEAVKTGKHATTSSTSSTTFVSARNHCCHFLYHYFFKSTTGAGQEGQRVFKIEEDCSYLMHTDRPTKRKEGRNNSGNGLFLVQ